MKILEISALCYGIDVKWEKQHRKKWWKDNALRVTTDAKAIVTSEGPLTLLQGVLKNFTKAEEK